MSSRWSPKQTPSPQRNANSSRSRSVISTEQLSCTVFSTVVISKAVQKSSLWVSAAMNYASALWGGLLKPPHINMIREYQCKCFSSMFFVWCFITDIVGALLKSHVQLFVIYKNLGVKLSLFLLLAKEKHLSRCVSKWSVRLNNCLHCCEGWRDTTDL